MKQLIKKSVNSKTSLQENSKYFTISDIGNLLLEINELSNHKIDIKQGRAGVYKITVGESTYNLSTEKQTVYGEN